MAKKDKDNIFSTKEIDEIEKIYKEEKYKKNPRKKRRNIETNIVSLIFVGIFAIMVFYMLNFNGNDAAKIEKSAYNPRFAKQSFENPVRRGAILSADGKFLAQTLLNEQGEEYRTYPYGALFAPPVGMDRGGGSGLEGAMNADLITPTNKTPVTNPATNIKKEEFYGDNVYTTLDVDVQKAAYDALGNEKGAVIAIDPSTGKIIAMVSKPTFDPNKASTEYPEWAALSPDDSVLVNRATQGLYPPGSTFKVLTALEFIKEKPSEANKFQFTCRGTIHPPGGVEIRCQNNTAHGHENLNKAFVVSCNCAFSTIGTELNLEEYRQTAESMGMNKRLPIEIESAVSKFNLGPDSSFPEVQETSFGQGKTLITPLQNLMITASVANSGTMMKPYLVDKVQANDGTLVRQFAPIVYNGSVASVKETKEVATLMRNMVSQSLYGIFGSRYDVCGKTGTAEYENNINKAHMWFTCFAPYSNPKIAVIAVVEKSEINPTKAPRIAKKVLDAYFSKYPQ